MAHPHNEPDSEFADRIDDLQEIEDSLESPPTIQTVDEKTKADYKKQINELQSALAHQRHLNNAMAKGLMPKELKAEHQARQQPAPKDWGEAEWALVPESVQKAIGLLSFLKLEIDYLPEDIHERINQVIHSLECENTWDARQQPVRKTLDEVKDEVARKYGYDSWEQLLDTHLDLYDKCDSDAKIAVCGSLDKILDDCHSSLDQTKAVEPQQGWVSIKDRMPEENQLVDIWKHDSYRDDWFRQINVIYKDEHICEFSHWMPSFLPPTQTNN